jgi:ABC-type transport system involved in cytochrome c biogenesis permease subunit
MENEIKAARALMTRCLYEARTAAYYNDIWNERALAILAASMFVALWFSKANSICLSDL